MPSVDYSISPYKRSDNTYQIRIRVTHNRKVGYISTKFNVSKEYLSRNGRIIYPDLLNIVNERVNFYRQKLFEMGWQVENKTVRQLCSILGSMNLTNEPIDLIPFFETQLKNLRLTRAKNTVSGYVAAINHIRQFSGGKLYVTDFNSKFLKSFEIYLRTKSREVENKRVTYIHSTAIRLYMTYIRSLFNMALAEYNTDDYNIITSNPFKRYKLPLVDMPLKRNLSPSDVRRVRCIQCNSETEERARDVFLISFYLCGMNTADIYSCPKQKGGRVTYYRQKTKGRRKDHAMISIQVQPELVPLLDKYADSGQLFNFHTFYNTFANFNKNVNLGLNSIGKRLNLDQNLTTYFARHSWATIARNDCKINKEDVHLALNHASDMAMTDKYINADFSAVDRANRAVLDLIFETAI